MVRYGMPALVCALLLLVASCNDIKITLSVSGGGTLEDALLIVSDNGNVPRETYILGDIVLADTTLTFNHDVDNQYTHWWLIGSQGGNVVYSSSMSLTGTGLYEIDPYDGVSPTDWNIITNLDGYANGTTYSFDWWAQTVNNHTAHVVADENAASLWEFPTSAVEIGTIHVDLRY